MTDTSREDALLRDAWNDFCDQLKSAGELPFRPLVPQGDLSRAAGFRTLAQNISLALQFQLENSDPVHPELLHYFDPLRKQGGDNPDAVYVGAPINGTDTYRIHGHRGTARYFAVTAVETGSTPWGGKVAQTLFGKDIKTEADGSFELICSPHPHPGNWLHTTPNTFRVTFRQFFADWENETPLKARIDRLTDKAPPPPRIDAQRMAEGLRASGRWVGDSIRYWAEMIEMWKARRNTFLSYRQLDNNGLDVTPGGEPLVAYWAIPDDEAMIIRVKPPKALYWAVEFGNYWWCSMDYRNRLSTTNCHFAQLEDDGELIIVISHADPGVANWLDASGFNEGYVCIRWMQADHYPQPVATQVKLADLGQHLPAKAKRVTAAQRAEQIATRRRGTIQRFGV
ncbi:MAG: DUF1214 domain-containing protein [Proteobacteria bacterium]|nr:DUF1214 domain-containing protein [Pseudomonadota bacterium]HQR05163.1 DUF1214 domain-containing protein [Rhodocyclaceae bacterium]